MAANRRPRKNDSDDARVDHVRPPTHAVMTKHGTQNELHIENKMDSSVKVNNAGRR